MGFTLVKFQPSFEGIYGRACRDEDFQVADADLVEAIQAVWGGLVDQNLLRPSEVSEAAAQEWQQRITKRILAYVGVPEGDVEVVTSRIDELFMDPASYRVYDEVPEVLADLRSSGLTLGIVSNWDWHLPRLCRRLGVDRHLHFIVTSARVGASKPDVKIFQEAFQLAGVSPERTLHVGDSYRADVLGAREAGADAVLLERGDKPPLETVEVDDADDVSIIRDLGELPSLILE
jgi:putative hydrolase of the HAD superfamily